jgi:hypothetical protein
MYFETLKLRDYDNRISLESSLFVQGLGNEKYTFNGGLLANTPEIAVHYPQRALLKIPILIESVEENIKNLQKNISDLRKFMQEEFKSESELVGLKREVQLMKQQIDGTIETKEKTIEVNFNLSESQMIDIHAKMAKMKV